MSLKVYVYKVYMKYQLLAVLVKGINLVTKERVVKNLLMLAHCHTM